jgi:Ca2+-binding RTX toxin-like protein
MAIIARNDFDRLTNGLATGNVVSGVNTLSGNAGKDTAGVAPNKVTQIQLGLNAPVDVLAGGADIAGSYGTLHINPDGSYSYTRAIGNLIGVTPGDADVFTYTLTDKNGAFSTAKLAFEVLPETIAVADKNGVHKGTAYDDFIDTWLYSIKTADGLVTVDGGDGQDKIDATDGTGAHLLGGAGDDWLIGGTGNAVLEGGAGADRIDGAGDNDVASYASAKSGVVASLFNNNGNTGGDAAGDILLNIEHLTGSAFNDALTGDGLNNILSGGKGNDVLSGLSGADTLIGGAGADTLNGGNDFDIASYAGASAAVLVNLANTALSTGDAKGDSYVSIEELDGSKFNDIMIGGDGSDNLFGQDGADKLDGGAGKDSLIGASGNDQLFGGAGIDALFGGADNDVLDGGSDVDSLFGGVGNDVLIGGGGADGHFGDDGIDRVSYANLLVGLLIDLSDTDNSTGDATGDVYQQVEILEGTQGDDTVKAATISSIWTIWGGKGNDTLVGDIGFNKLDGGDGNDTVTGGAGYDTLTGGAGDDTISTGADGGVILADAGKDSLTGTFALLDAVSFANSKTGVTLDLTNSAANTGFAKGDSYLLIDEYFGSDAADKFFGSIVGDVFHGGLGADKLDGRGGADELFGDAGIDTFVFGIGELYGSKDTITDFKFGEDKLEFLDVLDDGNLNNNLEDLLNAGLNASSSGTTLSIFVGDQLAVTINGWSGPQITSLQDLSLALDSNLSVIHP